MADEIMLPRDLLNKILLLSDIGDIFKWCVINKEIRSICNDELFWEDKLNLTYPGYVGNLYKKSYKETVKILYFGKRIKYNNFDTIKIYGDTSIYNIAKPEHSWELSYWYKPEDISGELDVLAFHPRVDKFYTSPYILDAIGRGYELLYTILLEDGENLFMRAYKLDTWMPSESSSESSSDYD